MGLPTRFFAQRKASASFNGHCTVWWTATANNRIAGFHQRPAFRPYSIWWGTCKTLAQANHGLGRPLHSGAKIRTKNWYWRLMSIGAKGSSPLEYIQWWGVFTYANSFIAYIATTDNGIDIIAKAAGHPDRDTDTLLLFANSDAPYVKLSANALYIFCLTLI